MILSLGVEVHIACSALARRRDTCACIHEADPEIAETVAIRQVHRPKSITPRRIRLSRTCSVRFRLLPQGDRHAIGSPIEEIASVDSETRSPGATSAADQDPEVEVRICTGTVVLATLGASAGCEWAAERINDFVRIEMDNSCD